MVKKKFKTDLNKLKDISSSWIGTLNIVKMDILYKVIYRFSVIPIKITMGFFCRTREAEYSFHSFIFL